MSPSPSVGDEGIDERGVCLVLAGQTQQIHLRRNPADLNYGRCAGSSPTRNGRVSWFDHAAFFSALWNWTDTAHGIPSRTWMRHNSDVLSSARCPD
jgi:hypothetical protein